jgi:hypothetical protein
VASDRHRTAEYRIRERQSGLFGKARPRRWPSIDEQIALAIELRMIDAEINYGGGAAAWPFAAPAQESSASSIVSVC